MYISYACLYIQNPFYISWLIPWLYCIFWSAHAFKASSIQIGIVHFMHSEYTPHKLTQYLIFKGIKNLIYSNQSIFLAATKQLYKWYLRLSVRLSVCPSVCLSVTPFWLCSHHRIIMKFSGVITNDQSKVHAKGQGQRSRSQRSQPNLTVSGCNSSLNSHMMIKWCT